MNLVEICGRLMLPLLAILLRCSGSRSSARPFYAIGHMANSFYDVRRFLDEGANAIEADVSFDRDGTPTIVYHGFPCDCWRFCFWKVSFPDYLDYVRNVNTPGGDSPLNPPLALLYLDLKVSELSDDALARAGENLAKLVQMHLFNEENESAESSRTPWILLGVPDVPHVLVFKHFRHTFHKQGFGHLLNRIGYDVYVSARGVHDVLAALEENDITANVWLSSGITNCIPPDYRQLENLIKMRDEGLRVDGIYQWTIDPEHRVRRSLRLGVDALVSNYPAAMLRVLNEREFSRKYRLATLSDLPWGRN